MIENLANRFKVASSKYAGHVAIQYRKDDSWFNILYSNFGSDVESLAAFLLKNDVKKGDRVAILSENRPEWPLVFFASISIGAILIPLNPDGSEKEIENILMDSGSRILFTSDGPLSKKASSISRASLKDIISIDSDRFKEALRSSAKGLEKETEVLPSDLACILYTSGTTDKPKGVALSHRNLASNCDSLGRLNLFTEKDSIFSILPLHHAYPLTVTMILPLVKGCRIIYPGTIRTEELMAAMKKTSPTFFIAVPQVFYAFRQRIMERFRKIPFPFNLLFKFIMGLLYRIRVKTGINLARYLFYGFHRRFGKNLRLFVSGGAKLDESVEEMFFKLGFTVLEGYGLTETSPVLTMNPLKKPKIGSVGPPIPGVQLKIEDKDKKGVGEVVVRGPNIMPGYYKRKDLTEEVIKDGWFHTGDLGYLDKEGYLFLTGRTKEVIVLSSGLNIYPDEIEEAYSKHAPVKEMCVFEVPAKKGLEESLVLWAIVVPDLEYFRKHGEINLKAVIRERFDNVSRDLPLSQRLMGFSITLEPLPRTLLGKTKRFAVKELYTPKIIEEKEAVLERKELSKEEKALLESEWAKLIIDYLKKQTKIKKDISLADLLELDLGIDSLGRIELASGLEGVFNMKIKDEIIGRAFTVRDLVLGIEALLKEGAEALSRGEKVAAASPGYWNRLLQVLPRKESLEKIDLNPGFGAWIAGFLFISFFYIVFKIFYNLKAEGRDNIPKKGPFIFYVNHTSYFDGLLVAAALPNFPKLDLFFVGFRPYFNVPIIRNLIKIGRIIPLDFSSHLLEAMRGAFYVLKNKRCLCLFPEGFRTLDGSLGQFKRGFGILIKESKARLVPVYLEGSYEAWPRTSKFPRLHPIKVKFGQALEHQEVEEAGYRLGARDSYEAICIGAKDFLSKLGG